ncbi:MAG TPA: hypothetical protein VI685_08295 [Candidatus Angelobacter sp.]
MKTSLAILFLTLLSLAQAPDAQKGKHPRLGFRQSKGATEFVDTDVFDEQKYVEETGADSTSIKAKRAAHEAILMREFMDGFNQAKECDGIVMLGAGDNKPDFELQVIIDSHDTPGQKTVWNWVLRDMSRNQILPVGNVDSGKEAAKGICTAVWKNTEADRKKPA